MKTIAGMACFLAALSCSQGYVQNAALEIKPSSPRSSISTCFFLPGTINNICCDSICSDALLTHRLQGANPSLGPGARALRQNMLVFCKGK